MSMASTISYPVRTGVASPMLLVLTFLACSTINLACNSELQGSPTESSSQPQQETDIFSDLDNTDSSYSPELPIWFENLVRFLNSYWLKQSLVNIAIVELPEGVSRFISHNTELLIVDGTPVSGVLVVVGGAAIYSGVSQGICAVCAGTLFSEAIDNEILFRLAFSSGITSYFGRFFSRISRLRSWNLPSNSVDSSELSKAFVHPFDSALTASWSAAITAAFLNRDIVGGILGGFIYGAVTAFCDQKNLLFSFPSRMFGSYILAQLVSSAHSHPLSAGLHLGSAVANVGASIAPLIDIIASVAKSENP